MTSPGAWNLAPSGYPAGAVSYTGPVLFPNGINPGTTQTLLMVLGPGGASVSVPSPFAGASGPAPSLRNANLTMIPYGESLPSPPASWSEVSPGAPGVAAVYDLNYSLNGGQPGNPGTYLISTAEDLVGSLFEGATILWDSVSNAFHPTALPVGSWYNATAVSSTTGGTGQTQLSFITIPAQPFAWWPVVFASSTITNGGTGTINSQVDLVARLNNQTGGFEVGRGPGQVGAVTGTSPFVTYCIPTFGGGALSGGVGQVPANTQATIYLNAEQQASTADTYSTANTRFAIGVYAVPGTSIPGQAITGITGLTTALPTTLTNLGQAIGQTTVPSVVTQLGNVIGTVSTNIQNAIDNLANSLGITGTNIPRTTLLSRLEAIASTVTAHVQAGLDTLGNALGLSGAGHTISDVVSALQSFSGTVSTNLQDTLDTVAGALAPGSPVGNSIADLQAIVTNSYTNVSDEVQQGLTNLVSALGGTSISSTLSNLETFGGTITTDVQSALDGVANALGSTGTGHTISSIQSLLTNLVG